MYRMQYRAMCNRETNRLPIADLQRKLGSNVPNIENGTAAGYEPIDPKYFVYYGYPWEFGVTERGRSYEGSGFYTNFYTNHFMLVEVDGFKEAILDMGRADSISDMRFQDGRHYAKFYVKGQKIGKFVFYCTSPEPK